MADHVVIFATSLSPNSRSQILAREAQRMLEEKKVSVKLIDMREGEAPEEGREGWWSGEVAKNLRAEAAKATHILFAVPIYNYAVSSQSKALLEQLNAEVLGGKSVGFLISAGGNNSYMAVLGFANSLMLDFRCWIVPRFVYATGGEFEGDVPGQKIKERMATLMQELFMKVNAPK